MKSNEKSTRGEGVEFTSYPFDLTKVPKYDDPILTYEFHTELKEHRWALNINGVRDCC